MNRDVEYPAITTQTEEITGRSRQVISSVTGHMDAGEETMAKIHDKSRRYMAEYNREPKHVILDSQSYLDLYAYITIYDRDNPPSRQNIEVIYTSYGPIIPIVLPQLKKRIQVIGDDAMFTATQTLSRQRNE